jgi:hypothetical protein
METKTIKTPGGVEVVLKAWISGFELRNIERPFKKMKMTVDSSGVGKGEIDAGVATEESIKTAVETVVISVGGKTENVYTAIGEMKSSDYKFILDEVDKVVKGMDFTQPAAKPNAGIA